MRKMIQKQERSWRHPLTSMLFRRLLSSSVVIYVVLTYTTQARSFSSGVQLYGNLLSAQAEIQGSSNSTYAYDAGVAPRLQWLQNDGYCGEVSVVMAGLRFGQ